MAKTRKTSRMERRWSSLELPAEKGITPNLGQKICSKLICFDNKLTAFEKKRMGENNC